MLYTTPPNRWMVQRVTLLTVSVALLPLVGCRGPVLLEPVDRGVAYTVQLTNGTEVTALVEHQDRERIRLRNEDGFVITVPISRLHTIARADGSDRRVLQPLLPESERGAFKTIALSTEHKITIRKNPTTQVLMQVVEWPGQTFLLWFPEEINNVWAQWDADVAKQDFVVSDEGALVWSWASEGKASVRATMTPRDDSVFLEIRVKTAPDHDVEVASPHNCLHFSQAPEFDCDDFSRIYVRVNERWQSFLDLRTAPGAPKSQHPASVIYREGFLESGRPNIWKGHVENRTMPDPVDHPLIFCRSKSGDRAVATASEDYQGLFYNQGMEYLHCIHSAQTGVLVRRGEEVVFREIIWFVDGGGGEAVDMYNRDLKAKLLQIDRKAIDP